MPEELKTRSPRRFARGSEPEPVRFAHYLEAKAMGLPGKRSGPKTRLKLMAATADLLETQLFVDLNVIDICERASVAKGTFYLQFETKEAVLLALLSEYVEFEIRSMPLLVDGADPFENTRSVVAWYEKTFRVNAGIMRTFVRLSDSDTDVSRIWKRRNEQIVERSMGPYLRNRKLSGKAASMALLAVRTMGGIMDYAMFARHGIHQASDFTSAYSEDTLIDLHSVLMFRALYNQDPPANAVCKEVRMFISQ